MWYKLFTFRRFLSTRTGWHRLKKEEEEKKVFDFSYTTSKKTRAPAVAQRHHKHLWTTGMQVQSLAPHSGLRIWHCHSCGIGHSCGSNVIPWPLGDTNKQTNKQQENHNTPSTFGKVSKSKGYLHLPSFMKCVIRPTQQSWEPL